MRWPRRMEIVLVMIGIAVFLIPPAVGWHAAHRDGTSPEILTLRGVQVVLMQAGVHEGLSWLYAWGPALGLRRSIDGGRTWSDALPLPVGSPLISSITLAVDPRDARNALLMAPSRGGRDLFFLGNGDRWQRVRTFALDVDAPLVVAPAEEGIYVAWGSTLWHWMPDGDWQVLRKWERTPARALASFPGHREIILLVVEDLWRSADGGEHWQRVPVAADTVHTVKVPAGDAYALVDGEVWHSSDWGLTWTPMDGAPLARDLAVPPAYRDVVYVLDERGRVWRRGPGPGAWQVVTRQANAARGLVADPAQPGTLYLFGDDGIRVLTETLPTPTPIPTPTPTSTPTVTPTPEAFHTPPLTLTPTPTASATPTPTPSPTATYTATSTPTATATPTVTPTFRLSAPVSRPTPTPTFTPSPTATPVPVPPAPPTPTPTPTATPTFTPTPLPTPTPGPTPTPTRTPGPPPER